VGQDERGVRDGGGDAHRGHAEVDEAAPEHDVGGAENAVTSRADLIRLDLGER
jgi:hypothetical protein